MFSALCDHSKYCTNIIYYWVVSYIHPLPLKFFAHKFILIIYGKNMNKKHGAKKLAMSTEQMTNVFLRPQGEHLQCF